MSEPEKFLERWSRRKRVAGEEAEKLPPSAEAVPETPHKGEPVPAKTAPANTAPAEPAFDPASLPPLDSIGAQTDITAFLKAGVPDELRLAALRRAWSADPAIRDFKGLAENDWDFTKPNSIIGFGEMDPGVDIKKMLEGIFGETPRADESIKEIPSPTKQLTPPSNEISSAPARADLEKTAPPAQVAESLPPAAAETANMVQREENIASQKDDEEICDAQIKPRRSQGRALPQ
jgi:hypothetical protein